MQIFFGSSYTYMYNYVHYKIINFSFQQDVNIFTVVLNVFLGYVFKSRLVHIFFWHAQMQIDLIIPYSKLCFLCQVCLSVVYQCDVHVQSSRLVVQSSVYQCGVLVQSSRLVICLSQCSVHVQSSRLVVQSSVYQCGVLVQSNRLVICLISVVYMSSLVD